MEYPPALSDEQLENMLTDIKDWQLTHGSLLKLVQADEESTVLARPVGATLFPSLFPKELFKKALAIQQTYSKLYASVAEDEEWLFEILKDLILSDDLTRCLWEIHQQAKSKTFAQDLTLGIHRSDYMLALQSNAGDVQLKQVELNTIACAGGFHSSLISDMHRYFQRSGAYVPAELNAKSIEISSSMLPSNHVLQTIISGLKTAHELYGEPKSLEAREKCILFIVQPRNFNISDERPIEYALWDAGIPNYRVCFPDQVLDQISISPSQELLYHPPSLPHPQVVSVVYFRAAFEAHEFDEAGCQARLLLEKSKAIKCPSILSHLTGFKKIQQALAVPGTLERWLNPEEASVLAQTFAPMYGMNDPKAVKIVRDKKVVKNWILKPNLDGGGHNVYGDAILAFLDSKPQSMWSNYILMERISSPSVQNCLMSPRGLYRGSIISELGVFGVCLWKKKEDCGLVMIHEAEPCWSFKTKAVDVDEMSVVKGYGCFDSPALVDDDTFMAACGRRI